jgi:formate hydrogenlyase subunit 3/multisubunit Na+/H+ antiporter MnhD subunit
MTLFLWGLAVVFIGGLASLLNGRRPGLASFLGAGSAVVGSIVAVIPALGVLSSGPTRSLRLAWNVPFGSFFVRIDPISALFLAPILGLSAVAAIYGAEYLWAYREKRNLGVPWFFYNLLVVGMALVVVARNGLLFLVAWEVMSLASFFLVTFEYERQTVRRAGTIYLVAMHIGTAFLIVFFVLLGGRVGSLDFDTVPTLPSSLASALFLLAVVGFGTKAGFMPLHVWLPHAHPAAPSHVSAVMSGVMIKTGIYGLVRTITLLGTPPAWWCWLLIAIGATSGILGVLFALAQHDVKRLLAYHSVENIGIITLGLGVGLLGVSLNSPALAALGFAGGLFHVINHAVFKGLLFLGAGAVLHSSQTGNIDLLGGLGKRMRWTALAFLIGSIAISGLPPLNGFASEFLIYLAAFRNTMIGGLDAVIPTLIVIGSLALIGGLALACFAKAFGAIFLGHPRSAHAQHAHEVGWGMRSSMAVLATLCVLLGVLSPLVVTSVASVVEEMTSFAPYVAPSELATASIILRHVVAVFLLLSAAVACVLVLRWRLLRNRSVRRAVTWDCGYARPEARMQYTATSFAQPLTDLFRFVLRTHKDIHAPEGVFPQESALETETADVPERYVYQPTFEWISSFLVRFRWLQHGRLQVYILYIALTLWILLIWKLM